MGLTRNRSRADGDALEVIEDAGCRCSEMRDGERAGVSGIEEVRDFGGREIGYKIVEELPSTGPVALPRKAVPASMPKASKRASVRLPLGSVTFFGCNTR